MAAKVEGLEHKRAVMRTILDIPTDVMESAARELLNRLHEQSREYAGPIPEGDDGLYEEWKVKREAFEQLALRTLLHVTSQER